MKLLIIPADGRQIFMAERLTENGILCEFYTPEISRRKRFDGVVFALPSTKSSRVNCRYDVTYGEILSLVKKGGYVFSAMGDSFLAEEIKSRSLVNYDYFQRDELTILNAYLTAEGVLELVLSESDVSLRSLRILVTGYGRTGKAIAEILTANLVSVTVAARKVKDRAAARAKNMNAISFEEISDCAETFDFVINTVPSEVIGEKLLEKFRQDCVFAEVASEPYGIDIRSAEEQKKRLIIAASLPGKCVPRSAGFFIADTIMNILKEEGINE